LAAVALRWNLPIHEVAQWPFSEVLRHFKALKFETEKARQEMEEERGD